MRIMHLVSKLLPPPFAPQTPELFSSLLVPLGESEIVFDFVAREDSIERPESIRYSAFDDRNASPYDGDEREVASATKHTDLSKARPVERFPPSSWLQPTDAPNVLPVILWGHGILRYSAPFHPRLPVGLRISERNCSVRWQRWLDGSQHFAGCCHMAGQRPTVEQRPRNSVEQT